MVLPNKTYQVPPKESLCSCLFSLVFLFYEKDLEPELLGLVQLFTIQHEKGKTRINKKMNCVFEKNKVSF